MVAVGELRSNSARFAVASGPNPLNEPPTSTRVVDAAIAWTAAPATPGAGLKPGSTAPVAGASRATRLRAWPPMIENSPPAYRDPPARASAETGPFAVAFQAGSFSPAPTAETFLIRPATVPPA